MIGKIVKVSGPLIVAENLADVEMYDVVKVSDKKLIGEVIELRDDKASIQCTRKQAVRRLATLWNLRARPFPWNWDRVLSKAFSTVFNAPSTSLSKRRETVSDVVLRCIRWTGKGCGTLFPR